MFRIVFTDPASPTRGHVFDWRAGILTALLSRRNNGLDDLAWRGRRHEPRPKSQPIPPRDNSSSPVLK